MGRHGEMLGNKDSGVRRSESVLEVLKACDASERAQHMGRLGEMLGDKYYGVCQSVLEVLKACDASERTPHMGRLGVMLGGKDPFVHPVCGGGAELEGMRCKQADTTHGTAQ